MGIQCDTIDCQGTFSKMKMNKEIEKIAEKWARTVSELKFEEDEPSADAPAQSSPGTSQIDAADEADEEAASTPKAELDPYPAPLGDAEESEGRAQDAPTPGATDEEAEGGDVAEQVERLASQLGT